MLLAFRRGRAVAVAAFEDRIAIFPTSIAAGNNIVDKVLLLSFFCYSLWQNIFLAAATFKSRNEDICPLLVFFVDHGFTSGLLYC